MLDAGDRACAMEVSSHALELHRADAIHFAAAIFTNLTQDHLDFHETMEDYFAAKQRLFDAEPRHRRWSTSTIPTGHGSRACAGRAGHVRAATATPTTGPATSYSGLAGTRFTRDARTASSSCSSPLPGRFNVHNVLGALAAALALGVIPADAVAARCRPPAGCPGRFEPVDEGQAFAVLVDYAHTPDSLENVLQRGARALADGRRASWCSAAAATATAASAR